MSRTPHFEYTQHIFGHVSQTTPNATQVYSIPHTAAVSAAQTPSEPGSVTQLWRLASARQLLRADGDAAKNGDRPAQ